MARRGMSCRQILDHYFPGTKVGEQGVASAEPESAGETPRLRAASEGTLQSSVHASLRIEQETQARLGAFESSSLPNAVRRAPLERMSLISYWPGQERDLGWPAKDAVLGPALLVKPRTTMASGSLTLSSEHFRVGYPASLPRQEAEDVMRILESARVDVLRRLASASLILPERSAHEVILHASTQAFTAATGQPWWAGGATRGRKSDIQPVGVLRRRGVLTSTLRHEYAHSVIEALGRGHVPRWLAEGLAIHVAGEGRALKRGNPKTQQTRLTVEELEQRLQSPRTADEMRSLYAAAYSEVLALIRKEGESNLWRRINEGK
jgi:hypothetical protein